jgi:ABC-2 type transport system ATP-binding protein
MLHRPPVLFLDEPTVGLDPIARNSVWDRLMKLRTDFDTTIFLTTHLMEDVDALCQEIAILHRGRVAVSGSPASLKASIGKLTAGDGCRVGGSHAEDRARRAVDDRERVRAKRAERFGQDTAADDYQVRPFLPRRGCHRVGDGADDCVESRIDPG